VARKLDKAGCRSADTAELVFEACRVPESSLVGGKEGGFAQVVKTLVGGRISYGGRCAGMARGALDITKRYIEERSQFGRQLIKFQVNQFKLAEWAMYIDIMHTITWKAAWGYDQGRDCTREASGVKLFCSETAQKIINEAIQLFGGYGLMMEYPIQRFWRDSRVLTLTEGVSEVHRSIIFRSLDAH
jgi:alkylation response protein AidB-like acyl-CoA dehydrogenase